tara:strand:- start:317 stop:730 length:414 start_codon:yes stop_codon:yes gene_type:complete
MKNDIINVVGGLIIQEGKILICQRRLGDPHSLKWEFPGGKIQVKETAKDALQREIKEELDIVITRYKFIYDYIYEYKKLSKKVHLYFYLITQFKNLIKNNIHKKIKWVKVNELSKFDFIEGDNQILIKLYNNDFKIY